MKGIEGKGLQVCERGREVGGGERDWVGGLMHRLKAYQEQALQSSGAVAKSPHLPTPDQQVSNTFKSSAQG